MLGEFSVKKTAIINIPKFCWKWESPPSIVPNMMHNRRRVFITGSTGNLGEGIARGILGHTTHICLGFMNSKEKAASLSRELGKNCEFAGAIEADLSMEGGPRRAIGEAVELMGGIDVLIHAASTFDKGNLESVSEDDFTRTIDSNLKASFFLAQATAAAMDTQNGSMVFMTDIAARRPYGGHLPYCIAKAGVESMVIGLAKTLAPRIRVNAIAPYAVTKPENMSDKDWQDLINKLPMKKPSSVEEIAQLVKWIAMDAQTTTGQIISVDGGRMLK